MAEARGAAGRMKSRREKRKQWRTRDNLLHHLFCVLPFINFFSSDNGTRFESMPMIRASKSSAIYRSLWQEIARTCGRTANYFSLMNMETQPWSRAFRPIYFRQRDSYGAIRCIVGTNTSAAVTRGGSSA